MVTPLQNRPRRWWRALLLACIGRGTGQVYNGQLGKAVLAYSLPVALAFAASQSPVPALAQALLLAYVALLLWGLVDASVTAGAQSSAYVLRSFNRPAVYALVIAATWVGDAVIVGNLLVRSARHVDGTMTPTISASDRVLVDLTAYRRGEPRRGDIIAFRSPVDDRSPRISRIVGLPGETITIDSKRVFVSGSALSNHWGQHGDPKVLSAISGSPRDHIAPQRIAAGHYFVLDDNRDSGFDSRHWGRTVARRQIEGKATLVAFSRHPHGSIAWERIGQPVHRNVPLPERAAREVRIAMGAGPPLSPATAIVTAIVMLTLAVATPVYAARRRHRTNVKSAEPYATAPASPPCSADAVRMAARRDAVQPATLPVLEGLARTRTAAPRVAETQLAQWLEGLAIAQVGEHELRILSAWLGDLIAGGRVRDVELRGLLHWRHAAALQRLAHANSSHDAFDGAITAYRVAIAETSRKCAPLRWAAIQNDFGTILQQRGERSSDAEFLTQALAAYQSALRVRTRERTPQDWAKTQHNLGNCHRLLAPYAAPELHFRAAVDAYGAALTERTSAVDPIGHAMTLNNRGIVLRMWGAQRGAAGLAVAAWRDHIEAQRLLEMHAPAYAEIAAANVEDDRDLLRRLGLDPPTSVANAA